MDDTYRPVTIRVWHWLNMLCIFGLLATVVLRKTLLSWRTNQALIQSKLQDSGIAISAELAKEIAVSIRAPLWEWHIYLGYALGILFVLRVLIRLFSPNSGTELSLHSRLVSLLYSFFYLATFLMVISGVLLVFKSDLGIATDTAKMLKEYHELAMWFFVFFSILHIVGVVVAENRKHPGIVSSMIGPRVTPKQ
jgi:cytochrome b561